jgi:hypothetical protein
MAYQMVDTKTFIDSIKSGKYDSAGAARRGLGKAKAIPEQDKPKVLRVIESVFGEAAVVEKPKAKKEKEKDDSAPKRKPGRPKLVRTQEKSSSEKNQDAPRLMSEACPPILYHLRMAERIVQNTSSIMSCLIEAKKIGSEDMEESIARAAIVLGGTLDIFEQATHQTTQAMDRSGKEMFEESVPAA